MARSSMCRRTVDGSTVRLRRPVEHLAESDDLTGLFVPPAPASAPEWVPDDFAPTTRRLLRRMEAGLGRLLS